jgi:CDP-6-deoxy-D-xylo-4-hexulose-3-dehydrase
VKQEIEIRNEIRALIREYFAGKRRRAEFILGQTKIPLITPTYGWEEVCEALDLVLDTQVVMGDKVKQFESMFAQYIGVRYAIMVNSGSSANLLALSILTNPALRNRIRPGDEVITPAVTWATTVWPIINCGAMPVLVDVDLHTFNIRAEEIEKAITSRTRAIMLVHLLGNPCDMDRIIEIAERHNLYIIEDTCEAHGAELNGKRVGSFGDIATFSFFFSHHISTIEGGMLLTNNEEYAELAKAMRAFGWIRDLAQRDRIASKHDNIDPRYLFVNIGFNFRPTEMQGAFGIHQIKKLDRFIALRRANAKFWTGCLKQYEDYLLLHQERAGTKHAWFGCPITIKAGAPFTRKALVDFLEQRGVETRPIMSGNIDEQPAMNLFPYRVVGELPNSRFIMKNAFFFGNHSGIGKREREAIADYFREFMMRECSRGNT